jgi:hypothetical protein
MHKELTREDKKKLTKLIKKTIENYNSDFIVPPETFLCTEYNNPIDHPRLSIIVKLNNEEHKRIGVVEINFR